jgi:hypothetical protein
MMSVPYRIQTYGTLRPVAGIALFYCHLNRSISNRIFVGIVISVIKIRDFDVLHGTSVFIYVNQYNL